MRRYEIETTSNGAFVTITRWDGATLFLQGADAALFCDTLETTNENYSDDDVCNEYDDLFE